MSETTIRNRFFSLVYPGISAKGEERGAREHRKRLLEDLTGEVIEVGAGHGINFPFYPESVTKLLAVEPEDHLRALAQEAASEAPVPVEVVPGLAEDLPAEDGSFDAAVAALVLCTVGDQERAIGELRRVLRPRGELRFYEHVRAHNRGTALLQRAADATFWPHLAGGCHMSRDTQSAIERAGFTIESVDRFPFSPSPIVPPTPHLIGIARRGIDASSDG
jgi:ubiquinone/menaquinone biosynthesis C-methylase UbiE